MGSSTLPMPPVWGPLTDYDRRCTREFYTYYHPFQTLYGRQPPLVNLHDAASVAAHVPSASPDKALTAFCQLVALRLRVRRAVLFFFDDRYGYVLAEATQSLSLQHDSIHEPGDGLWLGHSAIPKGFSVCEHTVNLPAAAASTVGNSQAGPSSDNNKGSNQGTSTAGRVHIINDLRSDDRFGNRPYVTSGPLARFYAGAPITTPRGTNIGALCALGAEPRDGLSDGEVDFLTDMAATIMDHLESLRARAEYKRSMNMIAGLGAFINLPTDPADAEHDTATASTMTTPSDPSPGLRGEHTEQQTSAKTPTDNPFESAASSVRSALDLDGVLFLDASVNTFGGLAGESTRISTKDVFDSADSMTDAVASDHSSSPMGAGNSPVSKQGTCMVLAAAYAPNAPVIQRAISQHTLRALCRRYPRGKIWGFNEDEDFSSASEAASEAVSGTPASSLPSDEEGPGVRKVSRRQARRIRERADLQKLIPGVQCLALIPIRDNMAGTWRAGAVLYTLSPQRTFRPESELNFMTAFGDVLVAELTRRETQASLQARSAFMSSLSHELRTPLHGILGTVEQLYEESNPQVAAKMVSQVELCGRALLDVINHLLDYSEVSEEAGKSNPYAAANASVRDSADTVRRPETSARPSALDIITEEAIEASVLSHRSMSSGARPHGSTVTTTVHVTPSHEVNWNVVLSEGAWKRICLNLVSNALKFTERGYVSMTLKQNQSHTRLGGIAAVFCVEDSGQGMSRDFMTRSLFRPFTKEDTFSPGAGLGMSTVAHLVRSMNGEIDVQSRVGIGTTVTVTIPLKFADGPRDLAQRDMPVFTGLVGAILLGDWASCMDTPAKRGRAMLCTRIKETLEGLGVALSKRYEPSTGAFAVLLEEDLQSMLDGTLRFEGPGGQRSTFTLSSMPIMLICKTHASARQLESMYGADMTRMSFVSEPYSSAQLAEAVNICNASGIGLQPTQMTRRRPALKPLLRRASTAHRGDMGGVVPELVAEETSSACSVDGLQTPDPQRLNPCDLVDPQVREDSIEVAIRSTRRSSPPAAVDEDSSNATTPRLETYLPLQDQKSRDGALTILLVDDNKINLQLLSTFCKRKGYHSSTAINGQLAVDEYRRAVLAQMAGHTSAKYAIEGDNITRLNDPPDLILLDINMPVMDGFEAAQAIRDFEKKIKVPIPVLIIALTGMNSVEARQQAFASGIDLFFPKPVKFKELTKTLKERFMGRAG